MKIVIETIPHERHRYPTVGDYWIDPDNTLQIRVSSLGNELQEVAVAIHELIEVMLCRQRGIDLQSIDEFDMEYERSRTPEDQTSEPGDAIDAPYRLEHRFAENIERQFIHEAGIDWDEYNEKVENV